MTENHEDGGTQPDNCDCCGRDAEDCRIAELGWVVCEPGDELSGTYCLPCAASLRLLPWFERCAICEATVEDEEEAEQAGWRYFADGHGALHPCCPACVERTARLRAPRRS